VVAAVAVALDYVQEVVLILVLETVAGLAAWLFVLMIVHQVVQEPVIPLVF
jgi:hypothetical protein